MHGALSRADYAEERAADKDRLQIANERLRLAMSAGAIGAWDFDAGANKLKRIRKCLRSPGFPRHAINLDALFAIVHRKTDLPRKKHSSQRSIPKGTVATSQNIGFVEPMMARCVGSARRRKPFLRRANPSLDRSEPRHHAPKGSRGTALEKAQLADQMVKVAASVPGVICSFRRSPDGKNSLPYVSGHFPDVFGLLPEDVKDDVGPLFQRIHADDIET